MPGAARFRDLIEQWGDHGALGEAMETVVGDDEDQTPTLLGSVCEPDLAG